jgi:hypothetical protein
MINIKYINTIPNLNTNILHNSVKFNLTNIISNSYSENEFNNLILNSNLDNYQNIK